MMGRGVKSRGHGFLPKEKGKDKPKKITFQDSDLEDDIMQEVENNEEITNEESSDNEQSVSEEESDADSEEGSNTDREEELQGQLADVPFEELQKMRSDGREKIFLKSRLNDKPSRANKNRPMEVSSKKPVGRFREVIQGPKKAPRDPRFESLCGDYDNGRFRKHYSFMFDEELPRERQKLQKILKSTKDTQATKELEKHLSWIDNQLRRADDSKKQSTKLTEHKKREKEAVKSGKRPFFLKKSELKQQELKEKYESLKANGKLESFLAKKRHKNASKDHRYIPYRRTDKNH